MLEFQIRGKVYFNELTFQEYSLDVNIKLSTDEMSMSTKGTNSFTEEILSVHFVPENLQLAVNQRESSTGREKK